MIRGLKTNRLEGTSSPISEVLSVKAESLKEDNKMKQYSQYSRSQMEKALYVFLELLQYKLEIETETGKPCLQWIANIEINNPCFASIQEMLKEQMEFYDKPEIREKIKEMGWSQFLPYIKEDK